MKQEKLTNQALSEYRSFILGLALPAGDRAGFISCFGITREQTRDKRFTLLDEFESSDIVKLVESVKWMIEKFSFRAGTYRGFGDFVFSDTNDTALSDLLRQYNMKIQHSPILYGIEEQKPFMTLIPKINQARRNGTIIINEEFLLSRRLKDEGLQNPAGVRFGDSPAMESLCYAYFGWMELVRRRNQSPPQNHSPNEYQRV